MSVGLKINKWIRAKEVMVIGSEGEQLGLLPTREAMRIASEQELDLVEVAPNVNPPVCKIMDYGKYRYQQSKKHSSKQKNITVKEVKVRPQISDHDLVFKIRNVKKFLLQGNKAKITMIFRGREIVHASNGKRIFDRFTDEFSEMAAIEQTPRIEGHRMSMVLAPK